MRRDLHVMEKICKSGEQELGKSQAPPRSASPQGPVKDRDKYASLKLEAVRRSIRRLFQNGFLYNLVCSS